MSTNGYPLTPAAPPERDVFTLAGEHAQPRHRYWLHGLLLAITLLTTTVVGVGMQRGFALNTPFDFDSNISLYSRLLRNPAILLNGLPFSLTLLAVLLAHEFGHYLAARYYNVDVTLPFFIPAPTLIGTLGAFIRIRSAILSKRSLFDIGVAGPLAGFGLLLLPLAAGVSLSKVIPGIAERGDLIFGTPLILRFFEWILFPGVSPSDIYLHPVARAAWVGCLATAINLLPIGQLDGGHILYAFLGERTKYLSRVFLAALVPMGFFFAYSWLVWAVLLLIFGMRHPAIFDPSPIGRTRSWLGLLALLVLVLSFTAAPVRLPGL
ncbi:MAG TPA: site-2 protease family protein [Bryobacteraceae bacterium]|nr:site-2 protease family protein [Bryobacteraceae bacterium]